MPDIPQNTGTTKPSNQTGSTKSVVGISFPFRKEGGEFPVRVRDVACVKDDLLTLFKTTQRSRIMRPKVGHNAESLVFDSTGSLLNARLQRLIRQTVKNNEPRVVVQQITLDTSDTEVTPTVNYTVQGVPGSAELDSIPTTP